MRVLVQRVTRAAVRVRERVVGQIDGGLLVFVGFTHTDGDEQIAWMADKVIGLRVFADDDDKMNRSVVDIGGALLVVSQFTLYGDAVQADAVQVSSMPRAPEVAEGLYERFIAGLRERGMRVETGEFGAAMSVELVNDGPVTMWLER